MRFGERSLAGHRRLLRAMTDQGPLFSVIMPTFRRRAVLEKVLDAWERQSGDLPFEVVVVDDGSDDEPDGTLTLLAGHRPKRHGWRFASQPNAGPAAARNRALAMARGAIVLFVGDDIEPSPTLLVEHWAAHQHHDDPHVIILGFTRWPPGQPVTATMRHIDGPGAQQFSYHYLEDGGVYDFRHFYTSNVSIRRDLLDQEPTYFSTDFPAAAFEDAEFADRLARHGAKIVYHSAPAAYHHHHYDVPSFFRRQIRCGRMGAILFGKRPALAKFLRIREASWARLDHLSAPEESRLRTRNIARDLQGWHQRALRFASFYDPIDPPQIDSLLPPVFQYGYDLGLLEGRLGPDIGRAVASYLFSSEVVPAINRFVKSASRARIPLPQADLAALRSLAPIPTSS